MRFYIARLMLVGACLAPLNLTLGNEKPALAVNRDRSRLADGVRELTFDPAHCARRKTGNCIALCTTRNQVDQEVGEQAGKDLWSQIDSKKESIAVIGLADTWLDPQLDAFTVRRVQCEGATSFLFRYGAGSGPRFSHLLGYEWPGRCKVYAIPRGAAGGLE